MGRKELVNADEFSPVAAKVLTLHAGSFEVESVCYNIGLTQDATIEIDPAGQRRLSTCVDNRLA